MITTTETRATLLLSSLVRAYPGEVHSALVAAGVPLGEAISSDSVVAEKKWGNAKKQRVDVAFVAGRPVVIEAKVDAGPELDQVRKYMQVHPDTLGILLVPELAFNEALKVVDDAPDIHIVEWQQILDPLIRVTPIAQDLLADITTLQSWPGTKTKCRAAMRAGLEQVDLSPAEGELTFGGGNWPSINVRVQNTWVFGQIEGPKEVTKVPPTFQLSLGFRVHSVEYAEDAPRELMRSALLRLGDRIEAEGIMISDFRSATGNQKQHIDLGLKDKPYLARGYKESHVGVRMPHRGTATAALEDVSTLVQILIEISNSTWGQVPS